MYQEIEIKHIKPNTGQIEGLPANPRLWTRDEMERLKLSIEQTPELLQARGLIVYPQGKEFIILGGNMRYSALKSLGHKTAPCYVLPADTSIDKMKEIVIKDNGSFGEWDTDALANEWDDLPLLDWGCNAAWDTKEDEPEPDVEEDDFDETKDSIEVRCKPGDIWQLGNHRLMCGDSIDLEQVKKLLGG